MKTSTYLGLGLSCLLLVACHPNTGHSLSFAPNPEAASTTEPTQVIYKLTAPQSWKPLRLRIGSPRLRYSDSSSFETSQSKRCQVLAQQNELFINCPLPTDQFAVGSTVYYRMEYTFDGHRESRGPVKNLEVGIRE
jgi:hypothetical protein